MFSVADDVQGHVLYKTTNARVRPQPWPHLVVHNFFPKAFYEQLIKVLRPDDEYVPINRTGRVAKTYPATRGVVFEREASAIPELRTAMQALDNFAFVQGLLSMFPDEIGPRMTAQNVPIKTESFFMRDRGGFSLGPHTDSPNKLVSVLIYLARNASNAELGTSLYVPKVPGFTSPGGPHLEFEDFHRVFTLPYVPNTMVAFPKTDRCFHGVEPVSGGAVRDILFFDAKLSPGVLTA